MSTETKEPTALSALAKLFVDESGARAVKRGENGGTHITMLASTASKDRDGEMIEVEGWKWSSAPYPKLLWSHQYGGGPETVLGKIVNVWKAPQGLMIEAELADNVDGHDAAKLVAGLMREGYLDQGSVGFLPMKWVDPDGKTYTRENPGSWWGSLPGRTYTEVELLEFSIVAVPSQRDSILQNVKTLFAGETPAKSTGGASSSTAPEQHAAPSESTPPPTESKTPASWFDELFRSKRTGAYLSRAQMDRLTQVKGLIDEVLKSATPADETEAA